jgi:hypothetical protein
LPVSGQGGNFVVYLHFMAKYIPGVVPPWLGTKGGLCVYKMYGRYYARKASSLTGRRVKKDPRFKKTMENARRLGRASGLAALLYRELPEHRRKHGIMSRLTGKVLRLLKQGLTEEAILQRELKRMALRAAARLRAPKVDMKAAVVALPVEDSIYSRMHVDACGVLQATGSPPGGHWPPLSPGLLSFSAAG